MNIQKIFAGPRVKKIRNSIGLSQIAMANELDISPSYLNLIERNQRPITVQLILKLSKTYNISPEELEGDADGTVTALKEIFSDSLLQGELPGYEELFEVADVAPNVASGIQKLHEGYRQALLRLSELNAGRSEGPYPACPLRRRGSPGSDRGQSAGVPTHRPPGWWAGRWRRHGRELARRFVRPAVESGGRIAPGRYPGAVDRHR